MTDRLASSKALLDLDVIVLFPGGSGTLDMFHRATLRQRCADSELRIINLMNPDSITDRLKQGA